MKQEGTGIEKEITAWDGKSARAITAIYDSHQGRPGFIDRLITASMKRNCQRGATWLLKRWLEEGNTVRDDQIRRIYGVLGSLGHWEAKLHVLQSIPFMPIAGSDGKKVRSFLRGTLTDPKKLVRAWSYSAMAELARQHEEYLDETRRLLDTAARDEAASVRARIRSILKKGLLGTNVGEASQ